MTNPNSDVMDSDLVDRFVAEHDSAAFESLVRRHGAMVLAVCRRVLRDSHDADDAFQAVFLVLHRKAHSIRPSGMVANWLFGVAYRTALKAKSVRHGMRTRETHVDPIPDRPMAARDARESELELLLDEELSKLPDKYRLPIVLCELEGSSIKEAARQLEWPEGTVAGRLSRGRVLLRDRIARRGLMLTLGALSTAFAQQAAAATVPAPLLTSTIHGATLLASGQAGLAGLCSVQVAALTKGVLKSMFLAKLKLVGGAVAALGVVGVGGIVVTELAVQSARQIPILFAQASAQTGALQSNPEETEEERRERERAAAAAQEAAVAAEAATVQAQAAEYERIAAAAAAEEYMRLAQQAAAEARRIAEEAARESTANQDETEAAPAREAAPAAPAAPAQPRENINTNTNTDAPSAR